MKKMILFFIPTLFLLVACAQPRYVWQNDAGLDETGLQHDRKFCNLYAREQIPPNYSGNYLYYPYTYGGYPYYHVGRRHSYRHPHYGYGHRGYYQSNYYSGLNAYVYHDDLSRACLKGKGWSRINVGEG